jgi:hypothetical protein
MLHWFKWFALVAVAIIGVTSGIACGSGEKAAEAAQPPKTVTEHETVTETVTETQSEFIPVTPKACTKAMEAADELIDQHFDVDLAALDVMDAALDSYYSYNKYDRMWKRYTDEADEWTDMLDAYNDVANKCAMR